MTNDAVASGLLALLLRAHLAAGVAILCVIAIRTPMRRAFGPEVAARLWAAAPLAAFAALLSAILPARLATPAGVTTVVQPGVAPGIWFAIWGVGVLAVVVLMWRAQARFLNDAQAGVAGPALVGVICPRLVMPREDGRYDPDERALIRAHERAHMDRSDPKVRAVIAVLQCLGWFNPLVHLAAHLSRLDQELACDATVVRRYPRARAAYARALLKTQLATTPLPFGCHWARGAHPLEVRVRQLTIRPRGDNLLGAALTTVAVIATGAAAWAAQPPVAPQPRFDPLARHDIAAPGPSLMVLIAAAAPRAAGP